MTRVDFYWLLFFILLLFYEVVLLFVLYCVFCNLCNSCNVVRFMSLVFKSGKACVCVYKEIVQARLLVCFTLFLAFWQAL